ncbi:MAG: Mrp/NBP35 family ATP-binding protein [Candidatus Hadarchaeota archaeon]|nr:Mrp/NBP35 family ATP-binding protein [Candidatus Hadarchaeota archaeon]
MRRTKFEPGKKIAKSLKNVRRKVAVMSGKGGVGKSTVAANLALSLSKRGLRVGLLDCDMHGPSIPTLLGIEGERATGTESAEPAIIPISAEGGVEVMSLGFLLPKRDSAVIWRGPLKMKAIAQLLGDVNWGNLDYMVVDLPPGTGDEPLSIAQLIPDPDGTVIVTTPQDVALLTIRRAVNFAREVNLSVLGLIENMSGFVCPHCGQKVEIFKSGGGESLASELGIPFLGKIPLDPDIVRSGEKGRPFVLEPESNSAKIFENIVDKLEESLNERKK